MKKVKHKSLTKRPAQIEVVTLAVYLLGGERHTIDTEDVATKAHELAPGRFSWRKYPDQINLELVRVYLSAAKHSDRGAWLAGSGRRGWTLTPSGLKWAEKASKKLLSTDLSASREQSQVGSVDENRWRRERERISATSAWQRWTGGQKDIPIRDVAEVFRIDSYSTGRLRDLKINRLHTLFKNDAEMLSFIETLAGIIQEYDKGNVDA